MSSIPELITDDIITALSAIATPDYDFTPGAVEQERIIQDFDNRFPFIEVSGPNATIQFGKHTQGDQHNLEYVITYTDLLRYDGDIDSDDPLPKQTASVVQNLHKALMVDHTRGGYAVRTKPLEYGYAAFADESGNAHFEVYLIIQVESFIDIFDMSQLG